MDIAIQRINEWIRETTLRGDTAILLDLSSLGLTQLPSLDALVNLQYLYCRDNQLTQLPNLDALVNLQVLDCYDNQLKQLPNLDALVNLQVLYCYKNQLTQLPNLDALVNLRYLYCDNNKLTHLPNLDALVNLKKLDCYDNQLTQLPNLNTLTNLQELYCSNNKLEELPNLDALVNLQRLDCSYNRLRQLPNLDALVNLQYLYCNNNRLTQLPNLDLLVNLQVLYLCNNNFIQTPIIPDSINTDLGNCDEGTESDKEDDNDNLPLLSAFESSKLSSKCNNKENLLGDELDTLHNVIVIILPTNDKYIAYCYQLEEIKNIFDTPDPIYEWIKDINKPEWNGKPNRKKRVYKEPYSGIYFDGNSRKILDLFNTFIISPIEEKRLGTGSTTDWVSRMHGTDQDIRMVYSLIPISRKKFLTKEKITEEDYLFTEEDLNPLSEKLCIKQ